MWQNFKPGNSMFLCAQTCTFDFLIKEQAFFWSNCLSFELVTRPEEFCADLSCRSVSAESCNIVNGNKLLGVLLPEPGTLHCPQKELLPLYNSIVSYQLLVCVMLCRVLPLMLLVTETLVGMCWVSVCINFCLYLHCSFTCSFNAEEITATLQSL